MRLIDADELKFKLMRYVDTDLIKVKYVCQYIDSAPTVLHDNYSMGYQDGVKKVLSEKPRGEWLDIYKSHIAYKCSCCGRQMPITDFFNYCPNCGAYMEKEAEHDSN